jgi:hypothetical protein
MSYKPHTYTKSGLGLYLNSHLISKVDLRMELILIGLDKVMFGRDVSVVGVRSTEESLGLMR